MLIQDCADYSDTGGVPIDPLQQINVGYAKNICNRALHERLSPLERKTSRRQNLDSLQIPLRSRPPSAQANTGRNRCKRRISFS
jgi:hypothetical protein